MIYEPAQKNIKSYSEVGLYFDSVADQYLERSERNPIIAEMRQSFRSYTAGSTPAAILDIGSGRGQDVVYFAKRYPTAQVYGIDISSKMVKYAAQLAKESNLTNATFICTDVSNIVLQLPNNQKFDLIYVFFGALNTASSLNESANIINSLLAPRGKLVLTFVNKYYIADFILNVVKGKLSLALARWRKSWAGYAQGSSVKSTLYTPKEIQNVFSSLELKVKKGYSIFYPAWYQADWLTRFPRFCRLLKKADTVANKCFLWKYGEYTLFVFHKRK